MLVKFFMLMKLLYAQVFHTPLDGLGGPTFA
jgi:hypothetical protein